MISFMSEHTAEYALVTDIIDRLSSTFTEIVPMYLWLSREGNRMGRKAFENREIKLVAIFPRRPKVAIPDEDHILVTFNSSIQRFAYLARSLGIPVLAGVPLIVDLSSYRIDSKCRWFALEGSKSRDSRFEIIIGHRGEITDKFGPYETVHALSDTKEIVREIHSIARKETWDSWLSIIREIRYRLDERRYSWFPGPYKPFYLVIL